MKKSFISILITPTLLSCISWATTPKSLPIQTSIPSQTPVIVTSTPLVIFFQPLTTTPTQEILITGTETPPPSSTFALEQTTQTFTPLPPTQLVDVEILGCNTSFDIRNGMGEVTNAYVTVKNTGTLDLPNTCALLRAIDEGREHPDKKVCVSSLPIQSQITYKLTVDSTYKKDTIIQVDVTTNDTILLRVDKQSCRDISLFGGVPTDTGIIKPIP